MCRKIHFIAEENLHTDCTNKIREYEMQNIIYQLFLLFTPHYAKSITDKFIWSTVLLLVVTLYMFKFVLNVPSKQILTLMPLFFFDL